ncbi:hypothetical protein [Flavobacterium sp. '19STA2R22 D10 B1']|uniref:hypothetical protein n=1 Tax=Flavobacterium aerium TaxID=3037261 RepID=UPI00278C6F96|nr:hypothetical protein [Flavobacterium sp. '19STA2R22 D10 B1']
MTENKIKFKEDSNTPFSYHYFELEKKDQKNMLYITSSMEYYGTHFIRDEYKPASRNSLFIHSQKIKLKDQ